jgi:hypothetical protein
MMLAGFWELSIPDGWSEREAIEGNRYYESSDGARGLYVSAWQLAEDDAKSVEAISESFFIPHFRQLANMTGSNWVLLSRVSQVEAVGLATVVDSYDARNNYRIVCKLVIEPPFAIRLSFHNYNCLNSGVPESEFQFITQSLRHAHAT